MKIKLLPLRRELGGSSHGESLELAHRKANRRGADAERMLLPSGGDPAVNAQWRRGTSAGLACCLK